MVVIPKIRNTFCPTCKKHTEHKVEQAKSRTFGTAHTQSWGKRAQMRHMSGYGNHGRYSRPPVNKWRLAGRKTSKKVDLRYTCKICSKTHISGKSWRARKVEFK
jgi:large subunit ribosomal protein L44e